MTPGETVSAGSRRPRICSRCGSTDVAERTYDDTLEHRGLSVEVRGLAETVCKSCGFEWATDEQQKKNVTLVKEAVRKNKAVQSIRTLLLAKLPEKTVDWWFRQPLMSLQRRTPFEAIEAGDTDQVMVSARGFLER